MEALLRERGREMSFLSRAKVFFERALLPPLIYVPRCGRPWRALGLHRPEAGEPQGSDADPSAKGNSLTLIQTAHPRAADGETLYVIWRRGSGFFFRIL